MEKETILDYVKKAKTEAEKPISNVEVLYFPASKQYFAIVKFAGPLKGRIDTIYNAEGINYYLDCLANQENATVKELVNNRNPKLRVSDEFLINDAVAVSRNGKDGEVSFDLISGMFKENGLKTTYSTSKNRTTNTGSSSTGTKKNNRKPEETEPDDENDKVRIKRLRIIVGSTLAAILLFSGYSIFEKIASEDKDKKPEPDYKPKPEQSINDLPVREVVDNTLPVREETNERNNTIVEDKTPSVVEIPDVDYRGYDYKALGSNVVEDDMATQLDVIDRMVVKEQEYQFENLVVSDDYDAIRAICSMRTKVLKGACSKKEFMDAISRYMFENNNYIDGNFIESYNSLHPYGKYIVLRTSQGVLQWYFDDPYSQENLAYSPDSLMAVYDSDGDMLYRELLNIQKTR